MYLEQWVCLLVPLGILDTQGQGVEKPGAPFRFLPPLLGHTDPLWFKEGWKLDPAKISILCQPNGHWRNWWVMKLLSEDSSLPKSNQNPFLLRANPNLWSVWLKNVAWASPRPKSPESTFLQVSQTMLQSWNMYKLLSVTEFSSDIDFQGPFKSRES